MNSREYYKLPIIEKGFVWSENDEPTVSSPKVSTKGDCSVGTFKLGINYDYSKDGKYKVKAFLRDSNYLVYSKSITFDCSHNSLPPNITSIIPDRVKWGDTIMIRGKNFSYIQVQKPVLLTTFGQSD